VSKHRKIYKYHVYYTCGKKGSNNEEWDGWVYEIYTHLHEEIVCESHEGFESKAEAQFAAIGHISLLDKGEG